MSADAPILDLLDRHHNVLAPSQQSLGIGLFDGAYERDFHAEMGDRDIRSPILNEAAEDRNFVGSDSRRFYIRVRHAAPEHVHMLPNGKRCVMARWYTRLSNAAVLDDNGGSAAISLIEHSPGEYRSVGLMMVSWEEDRDLAPHCGILGPSTVPYPNEDAYRRYGARDHRVRLASMFGDMVVEYPADEPPRDARARVVVWPFRPEDRRVLPLHIFVGSRSGTSDPVTTPAEVFGIGLHRARRIYEAIGVAVQTAVHPRAEALVANGFPGIAKVSGGPDGRDVYYVIATRDFLGNRNLNAFGAADIQALSVHFPDWQQTARVLYVGRFDPSSNGYSYSEADGPRHPAHGSCGCAPETPGNPASPPTVKAIMAHEVGHIVTNKSLAYGTIADQTSGYPQYGGHFSRPSTPPDNRYIHYYNLIGGTGFRLWDVNVTETRAPPAAPAPRVFNQYADIRRSKYVKSK